MQRIRIQRPKVRRGRPRREVLPPDPHDPEILRAKAVGRASRPVRR